MIPRLQEILFKGYPISFEGLSQRARNFRRQENPKQMILDVLGEIGQGTCRQISEYLEGEMSSNHVNGFVRILLKEGKIKQHSMLAEKSRKPAVVWELA